MREHREAVQRRQAASLGSEEFERAAAEVAEIEIRIAALEEPPPHVTPPPRVTPPPQRPPG
ncbi:MAG: hypothetical protein H0V12_01340 [Chloroflexi bacterium]|nr:hypothetical protein [Chloroflexota bacterium]